MEGKWAPQVGKENKRQYNGKELNEEFGLDWNDYGGRFYDPAVGRFPTIDRFAEKYSSMTPYHYGANNPIKFIDVNGDSLKLGYIYTAPGAYHGLIIHVDNETGVETNIVEGYPQNEITENAGVVTSGPGWGNLQKELKTDPNDISEENREDIPVPINMTEDEFIENLIGGFESYGDDVKYEMLPSSNRETGNSNSLVGSVLRGAGSDHKPGRNMPGVTINVLPSNKGKENTPFVQKLINAAIEYLSEQE